MWRTHLIGKPLLIILGATAVGKTALAIELAQHLNAEIISADSRQIYRHMTIGTAKPTPEQLGKVPHHLIDLVNPDENLTLVDYQEHAYRLIDELHADSKLPMLVGGTGQYITAIADGWAIPRVPPNIPLRQELEAYANEYGVQALHDRLSALDPEYAARTHPNNVRRVVRALEVCIETNDTMTNQQQKRPSPHRIHTLGLMMPREKLYARADLRFDMMMQDGFLQEVQALLAMGYDRTLPSMSGVGYLELIAHLAGELSLEEAIQRSKFSTHDFIRRQEVWFKGHDNGILWHNSEEVNVSELIQALQEWREEK
jgi:tRNA dimethylallyltransferase